MHENPPLEEVHNANDFAQKSEQKNTALQDPENIKKLVVLPLVMVIAIIVLTQLYRTTFPQDLELVKGNPIGIVEMYNNTKNNYFLSDDLVLYSYSRVDDTAQQYAIPTPYTKDNPFNDKNFSKEIPQEVLDRTDAYIISPCGAIFLPLLFIIRCRRFLLWILF